MIMVQSLKKNFRIVAEPTESHAAIVVRSIFPPRASVRKGEKCTSFYASFTRLRYGL
jgi:hypothetical protein